MLVNQANEYKGADIMSRRDIVKRKEIWFSPEQWKTVEQRAKSVCMKTSTFIRTVAVREKINYIDIKTLAGVESALRSIGNNINQLAKKANETNSIYVEDVEILRKECDAISRTLNQYLSTLR